MPIGDAIEHFASYIASDDLRDNTNRVIAMDQIDRGIAIPYAAFPREELAR